MRRNVAVVMSGLTAAVVGLSVRAGEVGSTGTPAVAAAGVVQPGPSTAARPALPPRGQRPAKHTGRRRSSTPAPVGKAAAPVGRKTAAPVGRTAAPAPTTSTVNGASVGTQYGPVQVQLTLRGGRVIRSQAINFPNDSSQSQQINSQAVPILDAEARQAQSARIDTVSGATYTSAGYQQSMQSALDAAHQAGIR